MILKNFLIGDEIAFAGEKHHYDVLKSLILHARPGKLKEHRRRIAKKGRIFTKKDLLYDVIEKNFPFIEDVTHSRVSILYVNCHTFIKTINEISFEKLRHIHQ